jgi:nucleolar protein 4
LKVLKALDKKSAHDKELERAKNEVHDHRNLYLAKVGSAKFPLSFIKKF